MRSTLYDASQEFPDVEALQWPLEFVCFGLHESKLKTSKPRMTSHAVDVTSIVLFGDLFFSLPHLHESPYLSVEGLASRPEG